MSLPGRSTARHTRCSEVRRRDGVESLELARGSQVFESDLERDRRLELTAELTGIRGAEPKGGLRKAFPRAEHGRRDVGAK